MMRKGIVSVSIGVAACFLLLANTSAFGQSPLSPQSQTSAAEPADPAAPGTPGSAGVTTRKGAVRPEVGRFSRIGFGVKAGLLGIGVEAATPIARDLNIRGGADFFSYRHTFDIDSINYDANFNLRSAEASLDYFPRAWAFHISPGAILYNGISLGAIASVPGGSYFTLNGDSYQSSSADPVTGTAKVDLNRFAPKLTVGFGDLIPRSGRHFSVPFEIGFAYIGEPKVQLNLAGTACTTYPVSDCQDVSTSEQIQNDIAAQEAKFQKDARAIELMPLFSVGIAFNGGIGRR